MDEFEKATLMRTKINLLRNLDRINDAIDSSEFPLNDHMVLDDIKDSVKSLKCIKEIFMACGVEAAVAKAAVKPGVV